ncbi:MAG: hypothetical protein JXR31_05060 [Prolixibacteraceae bacterium]|nr:hypothetical protein [Prolixibacteraceae bacterium]MBN2773595.1 hypothetical protein [Prolixibacteraceae bacterium]
MRNKIILTGIILITIIIFIRCQEELFETYPPLVLSGTVTHVSVYGGNDGAIDLIVTGGLKPYAFLWSNNQTTEDIDGLSLGFYYVSVIDSVGQQAKDTFVVIEPAPEDIEVQFETNNPSETGASDGSINTTVTGGYLPLSFLWSNGETTQNISGLMAGTYILTVTDDAGNTKMDTIILTDRLTDVSGNVYATVRIGTQTWMKENLRVTCAPDSSEIDGYSYRNDTSFVRTYGRLYDWNVAMNGSVEERAQGICPDGWHIPSDEEYMVLEMYLGMTEEEAQMINKWRGTDVGTKLKEGGSTGFDAMLSGRRLPSGGYSLIGQVEYLWTSTEYGNYAWRRCLDINANDVGRWNTFTKNYGFSVRCIKDE